MPSTTPRHALTAAAAGLAVLFATGCSAGEDGPTARQTPAANAAKKPAAAGDTSTARTPTDDPVLAEVDGSDSLTLRITGARRSQEDKWLTIRGTITNDGRADFHGTNNWRGDFRDLAKSPQSVAGATIVDEASAKRYYVLRDTTGLCLCTTHIQQVEVGKSLPFTAQFPAPPVDSAELGFQLPGFPVATFTMGG